MIEIIERLGWHEPTGKSSLAALARSQEGHNAATLKGIRDGGGSYNSFNHENIIALIIRHVRREF
jgi:hypothetical protein